MASITPVIANPMLPLDTVLTFIIASALLSLAPGPDNIFVLAQSALYGRKSGILITLGLCTGLLVHTAAVALGVAVIFQQSVLAFNLLKGFGVLYLLYLAYQAFRSFSQQLDGAHSNLKSAGALYRRGILMNITNPKVSFFFLAFLPQFASVDNGAIAPQIIVLGGLFLIVALIIFSLIALMAGTLGNTLQRSPIVQVYLNRIAGTIFAALALRLAFVESN